MDPQRTDFPSRQPYEGIVVSRDDPKGAGRVRVRIDGQWEPWGPWCLVIGGKYGGANGKGTRAAPPLGADVLVFFVNGNAENPRVLAGHFGLDEEPEGSYIATDSESASGEGDNKVIQDERIKVELDARENSYGLRITPLATGLSTDLDIDMASGQIGIDTSLGVLIKSASSVRVEAPNVTINDRVVLAKGEPI